MNNIYSLYKIAFLLCILSGLVSIYLFASGRGANAGLWVVGFFLFLAIGFRGSKNLKGLSFTILVFAAVSVSMYFPAPFIQIGSFKMKSLIVPLLQIIMFGMGTAMSIKDFYGVIKMPKGVLIGLLCQFTIMPVVGFSLATLFQFPSEIAAGVVLIGSSPSGLASNVMAYLAKANVALSVTLTAVATVLAPFMTPLLMEFFAGAFVPIDFIHNLLGYFFGYWGCKLFRMKEQDCRTIALEVGMQNGGLASGIALEMGKVATVGLAPAVFGPWMNISGSSLASWWRDKKIKSL